MQKRLWEVWLYVLGRFVFTTSQRPAGIFRVRWRLESSQKGLIYVPTKHSDLIETYNEYNVNTCAES